MDFNSHTIVQNSIFLNLGQMQGVVFCVVESAKRITETQMKSALWAGPRDTDLGHSPRDTVVIAHSLEEPSDKPSYSFKPASFDNVFIYSLQFAAEGLAHLVIISLVFIVNSGQHNLPVPSALGKFVFHLGTQLHLLLLRSWWDPQHWMGVILNGKINYI